MMFEPMYRTKRGEVYGVQVESYGCYAASRTGSISRFVTYDKAVAILDRKAARDGWEKIDVKGRAR